MNDYKLTQKKRNSNTLQKKIPKISLDAAVIETMHNIAFDPIKFKRIASKYFHVNGTKNVLRLENRKIKCSLTIDFNYDPKHEYFKLSFSVWNVANNEYDYLVLLTKKPLYSRDLFIKIFNRNIIN